MRRLCTAEVVRASLQSHATLASARSASIQGPACGRRPRDWARRAHPRAQKPAVPIRTSHSLHVSACRPLAARALLQRLAGPAEGPPERRAEPGRMLEGALARHNIASVQALTSPGRISPAGSQRESARSKLVETAGNGSRPVLPDQGASRLDASQTSAAPYTARLGRQTKAPGSPSWGHTAQAHSATPCPPARGPSPARRAGEAVQLADSVVSSIRGPTALQPHGRRVWVRKLTDRKCVNFLTQLGPGCGGGAAGPVARAPQGRRSVEQGAAVSARPSTSAGPPGVQAPRLTRRCAASTAPRRALAGSAACAWQQCRCWGSCAGFAAPPSLLGSAHGRGVSHKKNLVSHTGGVGVIARKRGAAAVGVGGWWCWWWCRRCIVARGAGL